MVACNKSCPYHEGSMDVIPSGVSWVPVSVKRLSRLNLLPGMYLYRIEVFLYDKNLCSRMWKGEMLAFVGDENKDEKRE